MGKGILAGRVCGVKRSCWSVTLRYSTLVLGLDKAPHNTILNSIYTSHGGKTRVPAVLKTRLSSRGSSLDQKAESSALAGTQRTVVPLQQLPERTRFITA